MTTPIRIQPCESMSATSYETSLRLKRAGMPQPTPLPGQMWYGKSKAGFDGVSGSLCVLIGSETGNLEFKPVDGRANDNNRFFVFAPTTDYITAHLPEGWHLEMWDGRHSCKFDNGETVIRTQADSFSEAAALLWLELNKV